MGENVGVEINGKQEFFLRPVLVLAQARVLSIYRLRRKMGAVPNSDLELVRAGFKNLYC